MLATNCHLAQTTINLCDTAAIILVKKATVKTKQPVQGTGKEIKKKQ